MPNRIINTSSVNYIITAKHYGDGSLEGYLKKQQDNISRSKGIIIKIEFNKVSKHSVKARIWQGSWIADCECGSASFVDPDNPKFFCFGCGNRSDNGWLREVEFPNLLERLEIERLLLERPVDDLAGLDDKERAGLARPVIFLEGKGGLSRNWDPSETVNDLREQNQIIEVWKKEIRKV